MKLRSLLLVLFTSTLCGAASAQFSEVMEVRVTNVDVIVTKDGKPATGLTRDDFEVFENGVKKEISNFLEIRETSAAATLTTEATPTEVSPAATLAQVRPRSIIVFVDNAVLSPARRNMVIPHLRMFLRENVRPGDYVGIVVWAAGLKVMLEPTSDQAAIDQGLEGLGKWATVSIDRNAERENFYGAIRDLISLWASRGLPGGPGGGAPSAPPKPAWADAIGLARGYADRQLFDTRARSEALKSVIASQRGVQGRKVLVLITQSLSTNPAEDAFLYLDSIRDKFRDVHGSAMSMAREFTLPSLITEVAEVANSAGVSLYPIDAGGKDTDSRGPDAAESNRLSERPMFTPETSTATLMGFAADTGGVAIVGSTNFKLAFDTIANDLNTYYSLGYRSTGERTDRMNRIQVKLKKRGYQVRTRTAVVEQSVASEMQDAVTANLFRPSPVNDLQLRAAAGAPTPRDAESVSIPLTITIPTERLTLVPEGADVVGTFAVHAAFLRSDGAVSKVARQVFPIRFTAESLPRRKELTVKIDVSADPRVDAISVGVMDETSRATGFASVNLTR